MTKYRAANSPNPNRDQPNKPSQDRPTDPNKKQPYGKEAK